MNHSHSFEVNRFSLPYTAYPELFAIVGATVPDLRGLFLRGYGSQSHSQNNGTQIGITSTLHSSGPLGIIQGDAIRNIAGRYAGYSTGDLLRTTPSGVFSTAWLGSQSYSTIDAADGGLALDSFVQFDFNASYVVPIAEENRPINRAVRYLIRAL